MVGGDVADSFRKHEFRSLDYSVPHGVKTAGAASGSTKSRGNPSGINFFLKSVKFEKYKPEEFGNR